MAPHPLAGRLPSLLGEAIAGLHRRHGVDLRFQVGVSSWISDSGANLESVQLSDGTELPSRCAVVGVGVVPNTEWLRSSGLDVSDGVLCDPTCMAAPGVAAAGDVSRWHSRRRGRPVRVEHWTHAVEQATYVAGRILDPGAGGALDAFDPVPYFWSEQFGVNLQLAGDAEPADDLLCWHGKPHEDSFSILLGRDGVVVGIFGMNRPGDVARWRARLRRGTTTWHEAVREASAR